VKKLIGGMAAVAMFASLGTGECQDHVVSAAAAQARLGEARQERDRNIGLLRSILAEPTVKSVASSMSPDPDTIAERLPALTDEELSDLAGRAQSLTTDPIAGSWVKGILITVGVAAAIVIILFVYVVTCNCID
jgi:hypothetical protein